MKGLLVGFSQHALACGKYFAATGLLSRLRTAATAGVGGLHVPRQCGAGGHQILPAYAEGLLLTAVRTPAWLAGCGLPGCLCLSSVLSAGFFPPAQLGDEVKAAFIAAIGSSVTKVCAGCPLCPAVSSWNAACIDACSCMQAASTVLL